MKDMMPLPVTVTATAGDARGSIAAAGGLNTGHSDPDAAISPSSEVKTASFLHSLQSLVAPEHGQITASLTSLAGGNELPLATETAITDPLAAALLPVEMPDMQDLTAPAQQIVTAQMVVSQDSTAVAEAQDVAVALQPVTMPVTMLTGQAGNTSDQLISNPQPMPGVAQIKHAGLIENEARFRNRTLSRPLTMTAHDSVAALQPEQLSADADPLVKTQLQITATQLPEQLVANKRLLESMLSANQPGADSLHAAVARTAVAQAAISAEPVVSSSHQATISETLTHAGWGQGMSKQVMLLVNQNIRSAELRLNPANLGPIEIRIDMEEELVNVSFSSKHAVVREAVEQALPRLREIFNENGLSLGDADISQHSFAEQHASEFEQAGEHQAQMQLSPSTTGDTLEVTADNDHMTASVGLVDYFI